MNLSISTEHISSNKSIQTPNHLQLASGSKVHKSQIQKNPHYLNQKDQLIPVMQGLVLLAPAW